MFLGISAALVGLAALFGLVMPEWAQWMAFAVLSLLSFFTFRRTLYEKIRGGAVGFHATLAGNVIDIPEQLGPGAQARVEFRGTKWTVRNVGEAPIAAGSRAMVVEVDGLTLRVRAE